MKSVYLLWHTHYFSEDEEDSKLLGVYSKRDTAENKIKTKFKKLPGFNDKNGEFIIDEYAIDKDHWEEGFITK